LTIGGTATVGDILEISVSNSALSAGVENVSYTVHSGDTLTSIATALAAAINADTNLNAIGVGSTSSAAVVSLLTDTYYTESTNSGATETLTIGTLNRGNVSVTVGGKPTTGDTLTITSHNSSLTSGQEAVTYTVLSTDTLLTIANGLEAAINADTKLAALGVTSPANSTTFAWAQSFAGNSNLPAGASLASVTAKDGSSNTKTNGYAVLVNSATSSTLTFDANGNMTSDGTNSYSWDAENRLIEITYPGSSTRGRQHEWT
jgi:hypothetical protein